MSTRSENGDLRDREIIELTEVVEEPAAAHAGSTPFGDRDDAGENTGGHSGGTWVQGQSSDREADDDDFDFSALLQDAQVSDASNKDPSTRTDKQENHSSASDFDDLEDLFDELDLDLSPEYESRSGYDGQAQADPDLNRRLQDMDSRIEKLESLLNLESRVRELEAGLGKKESWSDIEARIMNRLEDLVRERTAEIKHAVTQEIETAGQSDISLEGNIQELTRKVEEVHSYAVGPETLSALKNELWNELSLRIEKAVPEAAAKIIREEIQALQDDDSHSE